VKRPVQNLRVLQIALAASPMLFAGVIGFLFSRDGLPPSSPSTQILDQMRIFSFVNFFLAAVMWMLGPLLRRQVLAGKSNLRVESDVYAGSIEKVLANRWVAGQLVVVTTREGCGVFGLTICLLAIKNGAFSVWPLLWLNAIPTVIFIVYAIASLPRDQEFDLYMTETNAASMNSINKS
jgi:hypothetical protein